MTENSTNDQPKPASSDRIGEMHTPAFTDRSAQDELAQRSAQDELAQRYGIKRGMSRVRKIALGVVGFAVLCGVVFYIAWNQAHPQIQASVVSYIVNDKAIVVTFEVDKSANQRVECTLQAEDIKGNVIGSANVSVPSGRAKADMVYTVNTTGTPNTAVVSSCSATS
ncbi:MAG TPA: DUF4307 domain-containing protein [Actinospica sp.]|nr:DUF4307 domain-containing protein [Actinospica sp.]